MKSASTATRPAVPSGPSNGVRNSRAAAIGPSFCTTSTFGAGATFSGSIVSPSSSSSSAAPESEPIGPRSSLTFSRAIER